MTSAGLLATALLICSLPAFTQDQKTGSVQIPDDGVSSFVTRSDAWVALLEPWGIVPNRASNLSSDARDRFRVDRYRSDQGTFDFRTGHSKSEPKSSILTLDLDGQMDGDTTCYAIRSYVVARDNEDSDSTHPAGYSTCQRASRYHLKAAVEETLSAGR